MEILQEQSESKSATQALGARLAGIAEAGEVYSIDGALGSGKTEFVRGFINALSETDITRSPTFSIVNTYQTPKFPVHHFDFYRINDPRELTAIGIDEYLYGDGVCLIEWGMMFPDLLPNYTKRICIADDGETRRLFNANFLF